MTGPLPLDHLAALTDGRGLFEHANGAVPRPESGYRLDDAARALALVAREDGASSVAARLTTVYLRFVDDAVGQDGRAHNRMDAGGAWTDEPSLGDWWGRAVQGLAVAATVSTQPAVRDRARSAYRRAMRARADAASLRTLAFAAVGASAMLDADPWDSDSRRLLRRAASAILRDGDDGDGGGGDRADWPRPWPWPWPEDRLHYANAAIPEALLAAGHSLGQEITQRKALRLLRFLLDLETADGHLSVTPTAGRGPGERGPAFDQQPIEVAAIAQACARAARVTGNPYWAGRVRAAWAWFEGENDVGVIMLDPATGAGYDGLTPDGRNDNRGAESTVSALTALQCVRRCGEASVPPQRRAAHMRSGGTLSSPSV